MAVELGTGVPWVMCKEEDAPDPLVSILTLFPADLNITSLFLAILVYNPVWYLLFYILISSNLFDLLSFKNYGAQN